MRRELRGIAVFVFTVSALYTVATWYESLSAAAANTSPQGRSALWSYFAVECAVAAARVLPLIRLLYGRPTSNRRRVAALVMLAGMAALYWRQLELLFDIAEARRLIESR